MRTREDLKNLQALPLSLKIRMAETRIWDWIEEYGEDGVYLSWSGGKDSTVLRHLIRKDFPNVVSVFVDTGLEYPEIRRFVKAAKDRGEPVEILRPAMRFNEVIKKYGYPIISKEVSEKVRKARGNIKRGEYSLRLKQLGVTPDEYGGLEVKKDAKYRNDSMFNVEIYRPLLEVDFDPSEECCTIMKKSPAIEYERRTGKKPFIGQLAAESRKRTQAWMHTGCNAYDAKRPQSNPLAIWTNQDILEYIKTYDIEIPSVYGEVIYSDDPEQIRLEELTDENIGCDRLCTTGCARTGCIFCGFGAHLEKGESRFERLKRTHPRQYEYCIGGGEYNEEGLWQPNKDGLGMGHVFDELNRIYGAGFIRY